MVSDWVAWEAFVIPDGNSMGDFFVNPPTGKEGWIETSSGDWINPLGSTNAPRMIQHSAFKASASVAPKLQIRELEGTLNPEISLGNQSRRVDIRGRILPVK